MFRKKFACFVLSFLFLVTFVRAEDIELRLEMPGTTFIPGSPFRLDVNLVNHGQDHENAQLIVALGMGTGDYWFYPSWVKYPPDIDSLSIDIPEFSTSDLNIIPEFNWPSGTGAFFDAEFISAVVSDSGVLISNIPVVSFGWTPKPIIDHLEPSSGPPGKILKIFGKGFNLSNGDIKVNIGGDLFPVVASGIDGEGLEYLMTLIPPFDTGDYRLNLVVDGLESESVSLHIEEKTPTGKPLGEVLNDVSEGMNMIISQFNDSIIPDAVSNGIIPPDAEDAYQSSLSRASILLSGAMEVLNNLPDDQKAFMESMMVQNGLDDLFDELGDAHVSRRNKDDFDVSHFCFILDTTSACLTVIDTAWRFIDLATTAETAETDDSAIPVAGSSLVLHWVIILLDSVTDGFLPSQLEEINLYDETENLWVDTHEYIEFEIRGLFDNQEPPLVATFESLMTTHCDASASFVPESVLNQLKLWITDFIHDRFDESPESFLLGDDIMPYGDPDPLDLKIDFEFISNTDLDQLLGLTFFSAAGSVITNLLDTFYIAELSPTGVYFEDTEMFGYTLDRDKLRIIAQKSGFSDMSLKGFQFDKDGIWWSAVVETPCVAEKTYHVRVLALPSNFVYIPAGTFPMGSPPDEMCRNSDEGPVHTVMISHGFYIQATEVTQRQWMDVFGDNPSYFDGEDLPVESVSWYDCCIYCNRLSIAEGLEPCYYSDVSFNTVFDGTPPVTEGTVYWKLSANGYRLPTEAEWEYACRAGTETAYNSGQDNMSCTSDANLKPLAWFRHYQGRYPPITNPVGLKQPNAWELFDMHGNVWEWCWDWYAGDYYETSPSEDPTGPTSGADRVIRGGGFWSEAEHCRSANRCEYLPSLRHYTLGFRVMESINGESASFRDHVLD